MTAVILDKFNNGNPEGWVYQAERYFKFLGFFEEDWLPLPYFYLEGDALAWFDWLFRNKQFYDWNHFKEKIFLRFRKRPAIDSKRRLADSSLAYHCYISHSTLDSSEARVYLLADLRHNSNFYELESAFKVGNSEAKHVFDEMSPGIFTRTVEEYSSVSTACQSTNTNAYVSHFVADLDDIQKPKVFDAMLHSCCPNVFVDAQSDAPIGMPDLEATGPASSEVQLFDKSTHRDMSERYVTVTSLDRGTSEQHIEFETSDDLYLADCFIEPETIVNLSLDKYFIENEDGISPGEIPSNETIPDVEQGKDEGILMVVRVPHIAFSMKFDNACKDYSTIVVVDFKE
nr:uncharacterized protein LOC117278531 isoform X2 [Nicotiana tomentosiformis]